MDYERICKQIGYRREDLSKENQRVLKCIDYVIDQIEDLRLNTEDIDEDCIDGSIVGQIKSELYEKAITAAIEVAEIAQMEIQIDMAEKQKESGHEPHG